MNNAPNQSSTAVESSLARDLAEEYFRSFNENQFEQTAALFAEEGALIPPFDSPVVGEQAILAYLEKEAGSITAFPKQWDISETEDDLTHIVVTGKVNAVVFKVNVAWYFAIALAEPSLGEIARIEDQSSTAKIQSVRIKLLASPAELLGLQSAAS